ncbi:S9 family peptidase [Streptomyces brasiliensis]|uniref:Peptidase n=1 Tax=Streptomyces brasiliensis TaxID=1954 RepID=A0A917NTJ9_9ACTN|nr:prolyl oligopeptidase family serine peptidase [Streptomyces brasiliensis]GGJ26681.1 peptidase [Streptomyces brasiliensis]
MRVKLSGEGKLPYVSTTSLPAQLVRTACFTRGVPGHFTVTPDGATVLFLRGRTGDDPAPCLWALDLNSGTERLLADRARLLGAVPRPRGIEHYATDRAVGRVAFALAGALWTVGLDGRDPVRLSARRPVSDPCPDPTGRYVAYVCRGTLRVIGTDGTEDRTIAEPDADDVEFGVAAHTAVTASDGRARGHWWSPDGTVLLVARTDAARVRRWHLADPSAPGTAPRTLRYAAAGTPNLDVSLQLATSDGTFTPVHWDRDRFEYLVGADWDERGPLAVVQSRDQRTVRLLGIDPADGRTTVLHEQRDARWVQLIPGLPARTSCGALLAHADRHGTRHLTVDGTPVTPVGLHLRAVLGVDGNDVLFAASDEPTETHLWSWRRGSGVRRLSSGAGVHSGVARGGTLVRVTQDRNGPGGRTVVLRDGRSGAVPLASHAERPTLDLHVTPFVLGPTELRARLHLPSWYDPDDAPVPVLLDPYGGAARQRVTAAHDWRSLVSQWFAEQGFAVLVADGRGTPGRGPDWERAVHGDLFGPVLDDQVTALHETARRHPGLDLGRVGIRGWSFSGSLAALAVLRRPDVFHAAVAGAGVTDQRLYHAHWRERFLGHPDVFPERYAACDLLREAPRLTRPLLLIHGLADTNVLPANTLRLSDALLAAGRPHEVLLLPATGHQPLGTTLTENLLRHQVLFLRRSLGMPTVGTG